MGNTALLKIILNDQAGALSAEPTQRGVAHDAQPRVVVDMFDTGALPTAAMAQAGKLLDWLEEAPDLRAEADLVGRAC